MPRPSEILLNKFPFTATTGQEKLFRLVDDFLNEKHEKSVFIIKGYAGTGKTTIVSTLVTTLPLFNKKFVLMAPTGRAAKVMSSYSKKLAFTVHKKIYKQVGDQGEGPAFKRQQNYARDTVFIVDEASMINEDRSFGGAGLLSDLFNYVFSDNSNKLILIGDSAQLPPVGQNISPALDRSYLEANFHVSVQQIVLTEVMRQESDSGILYNATNLRNELTSNDPKIGFITKGYKDVFRMTGEKMEEGLRYAYDNFGVESTIIICRSNKLANNYNQYIRNRIHFYESELEVGEILMIVRNNYLYTPDGIAGNFIANGDFAEVTKIVSFEEIHGLRFATLQLRMVDYPYESSFEAKVILDTLYTETPALSEEQNKQLYESVVEDYKDLDTVKARKEAIKKDPYLNALQVKFAYALTCHKSQGGQWDAVFVDQGYLKDDMVDKEYVRWLYTAVTRATNQLFLVNFNKKMFVS
ncbi:RecD-like DNA helicase [Fulvivirga imtechensis AK7]|uniref:RecD-like DNA helicase n=1 Tax=Fulvivirga imtechensis AK7 TaxID=1237149 RepID=L8JS93_9BACT|nr:AAA family ATPase [Fulvivirga imtechensis]ELR71826.1 RecD-like DNA helicase [Fulvivirga imtechensis AK7]